MSKENSLVQVAVLLIAWAIVGVGLITRTNVAPLSKNVSSETTSATSVNSSIWSNSWQNTWQTDLSSQKYTTLPNGQILIERWSTRSIEFVRSYFEAMESGNFAASCGHMAPNVCTPTNAVSVSLFSNEYQKLRAWYEYLSVKDFGIVTPSWRDVVCVKYAYRYKNDTNPQLIWEILSFYLDPSSNEYGMQIATRVCEKKYKDGMWERACPIKATTEYCSVLMKG
jgi:hypothetical protein